MFDDGIHNDNTVGDGLYGAYWPATSDERNINVHIIISKLDSSYYKIFSNTTYFTTIRSVKYDSAIIV